MIARLRALADRPIADHERRRAFALAAVLVLLAAALLAAIRTGDPSPRHGITPKRDAPAVRTESVQPSPPGGDAEAAARRFLAGYLAYLYGRAPARVIEDASPELAVRLAHERLRVPPAMRERTPRIVSLAGSTIASGGFEATAVIDDGGVSRYPISLVVERRAGRREVTQVASP